VRDGAENEIPVVVLSTTNEVDAAEARAEFPAASTAVEATKEIPNAPSPVIELNVIILVVAPLPVTVTVAFAVPVFCKTTFASVKEIEEAPVYEAVYVTGPVLEVVVEGAERAIDGGTWSALKAVDGP